MLVVLLNLCRFVRTSKKTVSFGIKISKFSLFINSLLDNDETNNNGFNLLFSNNRFHIIFFTKCFLELDVMIRESYDCIFFTCCMIRTR